MELDFEYSEVDIVFIITTGSRPDGTEFYRVLPSFLGVSRRTDR